CVDTIEVRAGNEGRGASHDRYLVLEPLATLKGPVLQGRTIASVLEDDNAILEHYRNPSNWGQPAILFLGQIPDRKGSGMDSAHWPYPDFAQWVLSGGPYIIPSAGYNAKTRAGLL